MTTSATSSVWRRQGVSIEGANNIQSAISFANLDWKVSLRPVMFQDEDNIKVSSTGHNVVVREDGNALGVVGASYRPLQNIEAFNFFQPFLDEGIATLDTAGFFKGGKIIWVMAKLNGLEQEITEGDKVSAYLLLSNSHDGTMSVSARFTPIRVICYNTLMAAISRTQESSMKAMHTSGVEQSVKEIQKAVNLLTRTFDETATVYKRMAETKVSSQDLVQYFVKVLEDKYSEKTIQKKIELVMESYLHAPGAPEAHGTAWGAFNAMTHFIDNKMGRSEDKRLESSWFGRGLQTRRQAMLQASVLGVH